MQNICKIFKIYICIQGKLKLCKLSLKTSVQKAMQNFFAKLITLPPFVQAFKKKGRNPMTGSKV